MASKRLTLGWARLGLVAVGVVLTAGQAFLAAQMGAPLSEWVAPLLAVGVFAGAVIWLIPGGLVGAVWASMAYVIVLMATHPAGVPPWAILIAARVCTYLFYGSFVGVGARYLDERLRRLEDADQIDHATGAFNGVFFVQSVAVEMSRSARYHRPFSVADIVVPHSGFRSLPRRQYRAVLRALVTRIRSTVRRADSLVRVDDGESDRFLVILPETVWEGAEMLTRRLELGIRQFLAERDYAALAKISARSVSYPDDAEALGQMREEIASLCTPEAADTREGEPSPPSSVPSG